MSLARILKKENELNYATLYILLFSGWAAVSLNLFFVCVCVERVNLPLERLIATPLLLKVAFCLAISNRPSRARYCASEG